MDCTELNLVELNDLEINNIDGGGFFYELGVGAHMMWNSFNRFLDQSDITAHSPQGI
jgi:hypothetical protein